MDEDVMIRARGLRKSFGKPAVAVLDGIDLQVRRGRIFALLGPNGAGKTTIVRILATLLKPDAGEAVVAGHDVVRAAQKVRSSISLTGQYAAVDELLTGRENMVLMGRLWHLSRAEARTRSAELLEQFDLVGAKNRGVKTYSGGMRRRLDLAISLIPRPPVIFLDEPTTGLDPRSRQTMWGIVKDLAASGVTIFLTTQYLEEADQLADTIAVIDGGKIIAEGAPSELKKKRARESVELSYSDNDNFERASTEIGDLASYRDPELRTIRVTTDGSVALVKQVLDRMEKRDIHVAKMSLQSPSLDDVFFSLTGHTPTKDGAR